jgi:hypothetical protein
MKHEMARSAGLFYGIGPHQRQGHRGPCPRTAVETNRATVMVNNLLTDC